MAEIVILAAAALFAASMFLGFARLGRHGRPRVGGPLAGAMNGVDQAFAPTHADAAETLEVERILPARNSTAGDGPLHLDSGHVMLHLGQRVRE